jgi:hypothetical protein
VFTLSLGEEAMPISKKLHPARPTKSPLELLGREVKGRCGSILRLIVPSTHIEALKWQNLKKIFWGLQIGLPETGNHPLAESDSGSCGWIRRPVKAGR